MLECPECGSPLAVSGTTLCCDSGHAFDIAREGYVNLLTPRHQRRNITGDTPEMVAARRRFLDAGHYDPLKEALADAVKAALGSGVEGCVFECGCGEGSYLAAVAEHLSGCGSVYLGSDVSKPAVRAAAKRYREASFFVADTHVRLYLRDATVAVLLDVFAPRNPAEFARVLAPGGRAVIVIPASKHLASLRDELGLLGIQDDKERVVAEQFAPYFTPVGRTELRFTLDLSAPAVADLVEMGPNRFHRDRDEYGPRLCESSFLILEFERTGA